MTDAPEDLALKKIEAWSWYFTGNLRFVETTVQTPSRLPAGDMVRILQQEFRNGDNETEWRDVPLVVRARVAE